MVMATPTLRSCANLYDNGESNEGAVFVYHGTRTGALTLAWRAEGNQPESHFGECAATAGDVNGDGFADLIIGAPFFDNGETNEGRAYVYHGSPSGLGAVPAWIKEPNRSVFLGWGVSSAGDVNGDGYSDVIVGVPHYENGETSEGGAFVYHGSAMGLQTTASWVAESNQASALFGVVSTAGDVNGDGYSDVIVGAHAYSNGENQEGRVFVYHGSPIGLEETAAWTAESNQVSARLGGSVATAGDVDGDGFSDVIIGAYSYDNGQIDEGAAFIYTGSAGGLEPLPAWRFEGDQVGARFGWSVGTAGDVNGDGYSDIIVGAPVYANGQINEGRAYVYHGGAGLSLAWTVEINQEAFFGESVATAGDVNADGFSDVIVGASIYENGQGDEGGAFLYLGNGGAGLDRAAQQRRTDESAPIDVLGRSDSAHEFLIGALARSAAGRSQVRLQTEVKPFGVPFDGTGIVTGPGVDTGFPVSRAVSSGSRTTRPALLPISSITGGSASSANRRLLPAPPGSGSP